MSISILVLDDANFFILNLSYKLLVDNLNLIVRDVINVNKLILLVRHLDASTLHN